MLMLLCRDDAQGEARRSAGGESRVYKRGGLAKRLAARGERLAAAQSDLVRRRRLAVSYVELQSFLVRLTWLCSFTELVREDHANEQAEQSTKREMEVADEDVEKTFSGAPALVVSLLSCAYERYSFDAGYPRAISRGADVERQGA